MGGGEQRQAGRRGGGLAWRAGRLAVWPHRRFVGAMQDRRGSVGFRAGRPAVVVVEQRLVVRVV